MKRYSVADLPTRSTSSALATLTAGPTIPQANGNPVIRKDNTPSTPTCPTDWSVRNMTQRGSYTVTKTAEAEDSRKT